MVDDLQFDVSLIENANDKLLKQENYLFPYC